MAKAAWIKSFQISQELKNAGIEIQIDDDGKQYGDIYVTKTGVIWCDGKCHRNSGTKFSFDELSLLASYKDEALKAAKKARKEDT